MDRTVYDTQASWGNFQEESYDTPGFHKLRPKREFLPKKPYLWRRVDGLSPFSYSTSLGWSTERQSRGVPSGVQSILDGSINNQVGLITPIQSLTALENIVSNRLLTKVRNKDIDLGVVFGESGETIKFVSSAFGTLAKAARSMRRGDVAGVVRSFSNTSAESRVRDIATGGAGALLAFKFGLSPLLDDIWNAIHIGFLWDQPRVHDAYVVHSGTSARYEVDVVDPSLSWNGKPTRFNSLRGLVKVRGSISYQVTNPLLRTLDQWGLTNPAAVVWELVPLSFVVDWGLSVGSYIQEIVPPQGVDFVSGWVSSKIHCSTVSHTEADPKPDQTAGINTTATTIEVYKRRVLLSSFPRYHVTPPDWSSYKENLATELALLTQRLLK